jgi:NAD(P)-dependent dehydrogenase (short-subunit alcohol dehydrogenase family)
MRASFVANRLAGRTAVIFGGGDTGAGPHGVHGIGFVCGATFAAEGANVVVVDRDGEAAGHEIESVRAGRDAKSPTGSMGSAQDVANAALFLASAESAYITGTMLPVAGGLHARVG